MNRKSICRSAYGIKAPIIKRGDDIANIVSEAVLIATEIRVPSGAQYDLNNNDIVLPAFMLLHSLKKSSIACVFVINSLANSSSVKFFKFIFKLSSSISLCITFLLSVYGFSVPLFCNFYITFNWHLKYFFCRSAHRFC